MSHESPQRRPRNFSISFRLLLTLLFSIAGAVSAAGLDAGYVPDQTAMAAIELARQDGASRFSQWVHEFSTQPRISVTSLNRPYRGGLLSPDNRYWADRDSILELATGLIVSTQEAGEPIQWLADQPGKLLGTKGIFDLAQGMEKRERLEESVNYAGTSVDVRARTSDGRLALLVFGETALYDAIGKKVLRRFKTARSNDARFSPDEKTVAVADDIDYHGRLSLFEVSSGKRLWVTETAPIQVTKVVFSPDGKAVATVGWQTSADKTGKWDLSVWDARTGRRFFSSRLPVGDGRALLAWAPNGRTIVTAANTDDNPKGIVQTWDSRTGREIQTLGSYPGGVSSLTVTSDSANLFVTLDEGTMRRIELSTGREAQVYGTPITFNSSLSQTRDHEAVQMVSSRGNLVIFKPETGRKIREIELESAPPQPGFSRGRSDVVFSPVSDIAAVVTRWNGRRGGLCTVSLVNSITGGIQKSLKISLNYRSASFSPDGRTLAADFMGTVVLIDVDTGKIQAKFAANGRDDGTIARGDWTGDDVQFSPKGARVIANLSRLVDGDQGTSYEHAVGFWNPSDGKLISRMRLGGADYASGLQLSNDESVAVVRRTTESQEAYFEAYRISTGKRLGRWTLNDAEEPNQDGGPDNDTIEVSGTDDRYRLSLATGRLVRLGKLDTPVQINLPKMDLVIEQVPEGPVEVRRAESKNLLYRYFAPRPGESIVWTADGFFDGTEAAARNLVYMVEGLRTYGMEQFYEQFHRPDIIAARLKGEDTSKITSASLTKGFARPPVVSISFPAGTTPLDSRLLVRVTAVDQGGGIDGVRLFAGGISVGEDVRGVMASGGLAGTFSKDFTVFLGAGQTKIKAVGFSLDRTESQPFETMVTFQPTFVAKPNLYVVAAGSDVYRNAKYNLNFALADVQGFIDALQPVAAKVFAEVTVLRVLGKDLNRVNLTAALDEVRRQAQPQDVFLFFYAGHGIAHTEGKQNVFYFVLPGVTQMEDEDKLRAEGFSTAELRSQVGQIAANKQMLLVDACNSGAFLDGYAVRGAAEENALAQLQRSAGIALFSASTDQQFANEVKDLGHGLFTWALMQGLRGEAATKEGKITASSLKTYIDDAVPVLAQKYRGSEQFPLAKVSGQDFPVGIK